MNDKRTKIVATVGPACHSPEIIQSMIEAGVDCFRLNFSHGNKSIHHKSFEMIRSISQSMDRETALIADLQGHKVRIGCLLNQSVTLKAGQQVILDTQADPMQGNLEAIFVDYPLITKEVQPGDVLLLDDGLIELNVKSVSGSRIHCESMVSCVLKDRKGINKLGGGLTLSGLTEKDKADLKFAIDLGFDYIAVSFVKNQADLKTVRELMADDAIGLIAKIERAEAIENIDEIVQYAEAVMVARGDLGVELGYAQVPALQKLIIERARYFNKVVITATQMMESMVNNMSPTRAEVSDVANAVLDGSDAVMLSSETASGQYPVKVVESMAKVCIQTEAQPLANHSKHHMHDAFSHIDEAIAMATMYTANHLIIKAIICLTESGSTPLWMSRIRSEIPIYGLTRHIGTMRSMCLYRGVYPLAFDPTAIDRVDLNRTAIEFLLKAGKIVPGDRVILTKGDFIGAKGGTNSLKILEA